MPPGSSRPSSGTAVRPASTAARSRATAGRPSMATLQEPFDVAFDQHREPVHQRPRQRADPEGRYGRRHQHHRGRRLCRLPGDGVLGTKTSISTSRSASPSMPQGNVVFGDADNKRIRMIDSHGIIRTIAGTGKNKATGDGGPATKAALADPENVVFDAAGNLYITDTVFDHIRRVDRPWRHQHARVTQGRKWAGDRPVRKPVRDQLGSERRLPHRPEGNRHSHRRQTPLGARSRTANGRGA